MDDDALVDEVARRFDDVVDALGAYTEIVCLSPAYDPAWHEHGEIERAARELADWTRRLDLRGSSVEVVSSDGRTPVVFADIPSTDPSRADTTTLVYGHLDKQPPFTGWLDGLDPFQAVRRGDRLYGRGTADDGYALFAAGTALAALDALGVGHGRVVVLVEASEESGSPDLEPYLDLLAPRLGSVGFVVCLDSGCLTYDRLWVTTSFRGNVTGVLRVEVLTEAVHSGFAGGVVPSSFRIARDLLSRVEDPATGEVVLAALQVDVPAHRTAEIAAVAREFGDAGAGTFPTVPGLRVAGADPADRITNNTWRGSLAVTGAGGLPPLEAAGNVLRPETALRLSFRIPPTTDPEEAGRALTVALTTEPPDGARVSFTLDRPSAGWDSPAPAPWLNAATDFASRRFFGRPAGYVGVGGTVPFMGALGARFPRAEFLATGVLGPESNAHGPNEFLHLPTAKAVTATLAHLLAVAPPLTEDAPNGRPSFATVPQ